MPLGSTTLEVSGSRIEVDNTDVHSLLGNVAYVYAAPGKSVQLTVGTGSSAAKYTGKTNKLGRAKIEYDLPQDTLAAERCCRCCCRGNGSQLCALCSGRFGLEL